MGLKSAIKRGLAGPPALSHIVEFYAVKIGYCISVSPAVSYPRSVTPCEVAKNGKITAFWGGFCKASQGILVQEKRNRSR